MVSFQADEDGLEDNYKNTVDVLDRVAFMLDCMGITIIKDTQGKLICDVPVVPC